MVLITTLVAGDTFRKLDSPEEFKVIGNSFNHILIENISTLEIESLYHDIEHLVIPIYSHKLENLANAL